MKRLLFIGLLLGLTNMVSAQTFEHFEIDTIEGRSCWLAPKFDSIPTIRGSKFYDLGDAISKMMRNIVHTFPEDIKEIVKKKEVYVLLCFNGKGEIFRICFFISKTTNPFFLTDAQWLKIYRIIQSQKIDMSNFKLVGDFKWSSYGPMPISRYLNEADADNVK